MSAPVTACPAELGSRVALPAARDPCAAQSRRGGLLAGASGAAAAALPCTTIIASHAARILVAGYVKRSLPEVSDIEDAQLPAPCRRRACVLDVELAQDLLDVILDRQRADTRMFPISELLLPRWIQRRISFSRALSGLTLCAVGRCPRADP